jgi:CCR4-NOT transcription complex subunit 4
VTGSAFVTYLRNEDAAACIRELDQAVLDGFTLRACLGTTKYCNSFLRYVQCGARPRASPRRPRAAGIC